MLDLLEAEEAGALGKAVLIGDEGNWEYEERDGFAL